MRKIALVTGSRGEYGYIRPVVCEIQKNPDLEYYIIATNLHLLSEFGSSIEEIERDGFKVSDRIYMALDGYTTASMAKSLGVFLMGITDVLTRIAPDFVLLAGDRGEQLMAAVAAAHMNIPIAHIQAGELSGNIDGMTRHAITRFAHVHLAASADAAQRLRQMGEQDFRIHLVGAPQLDDLLNPSYARPQDAMQQFRLDPGQPIVLLVFHSVTEEFDDAATQAGELLEAVSSMSLQTVAIFPNNDAGSVAIRQQLAQYRHPFIRIGRNVPRDVYAGLMSVANVMVGNSSSGLIEAPCFKLPAVNVGDRQRGRLRGKNVIDVTYDRNAITKAIRTALSEDFKHYLLQHCDNPYLGDGHVSHRIVQLLKGISVTEELMKKNLAF